MLILANVENIRKDLGFDTDAHLRLKHESALILGEIEIIFIPQ